MINATVRRMREQTDLARQECEAAELRAEDSARALADVRDALNFPVDTVNRSLLFTNFMAKEGVGTWIRHSLPLKRFKQQNTQEVTKVIVQGFR